MVSSLAEVKRELRQASNRDDAVQLQRYFKTGPGEYGEGDRFIGVRLGPLRKLSRSYRDLSEADIKKLLQSVFHEERMLALLILVEQFGRADENGRGRIYRLYMSSLRHINNWDLVDVSAPRIVGAYLWDKDRKPLFELAHARQWWRRRVAVLSTLYFINQGEFGDTLKIAAMLLHDDHDLIHKAVGWMLREIGKRDRKTEERFLARHYRIMPRTMLRYAIERFPETRRQRYLKGTA